MQLAGILHRPESEDAAILADHRLLLRLRTALNDVVSVEVHYADPYLWQAGRPMTTTRMTRGLATQSNQYWTLPVTVLTNRLIYAFQLTDSAGQMVGYGDDGFFDATTRQWQLAVHYFHLPYLHVSDAELPPTWVQTTVWYQIFPDRFANGDPTNDPRQTMPWGRGPVRRDSFYGGDLRGVRDHLDDLQALGITGLYLCPIFTAPSNHKYDTIDHFAIDPHFGTKTDFKALVDAAHVRGMRVMLDAVFNHFGSLSPQWRDVVMNGADSRFADWFHVHGWPVGRDPQSGQLNYETFAIDATMPKVNTQNPAVQDYLISVTTYWLKEFNIDAWRFDVADEVDHGFWRRLCGTLRTLKPDVYLVGESWHTSSALVGNGLFDAVMNYPLTRPITALLNHKLGLTDYVAQTNLQLLQYRRPNQQVMLNALDTHDTPRLLTTLHGDTRKVEAALGLLMLLPGSPCLYYGTEVGLAGGPDPDNRRCMNWHPNADQRALRRLVQMLVKFRHQQGAFLAMADLNWQVAGAVLTLTRETPQRIVQGCFNLGDAPIPVMPKVGRVVVAAGMSKMSILAGGFEILEQDIQ